MNQNDMNTMPEITVFALMTCSHCKALKQFLKDMGIHFRQINVDMLLGEERSDALRELKKKNPQCSFPTIVIGDRVVVGHREDEIRELLKPYV